MSLDVTLARVSELQSLLGPVAPAAAPAPTAPAGGDFAQLLRAASAGPTAAGAPAAPGPATAPAAFGAPGVAGVAPAAAPAGDTPAARMVALAQGEVGQAEQPPGSNDSARIAQYRSATPGSGVGPWCAYFTSWLANGAGVPVGERGQGFGSVDALYAWAQRSGKAFSAQSGQPPQAGDLIVWDEHIGIVESVLPDGRVQTIEGNSSDRVSRRVHDATDPIGYVRLG
jgi:hypothetical protein